MNIFNLQTSILHQKIYECLQFKINFRFFQSRSQLVASDEVTGEPTNPKKKFLYKLEEFDVTAKNPTIENIEKIGQLIPELFSLSKIDTDFSSRCMRALLRQKWKKMKKYKHKELDFSIVAYLKLAADLYPTSGGIKQKKFVLSQFFRPLASSVYSIFVFCFGSGHFCTI